jgi:hypothetical protein
MTNIVLLSTMLITNTMTSEFVARTNKDGTIDPFVMTIKTNHGYVLRESVVGFMSGTNAIPTATSVVKVREF